MKNQSGEHVFINSFGERLAFAFDAGVGRATLRELDERECLTYPVVDGMALGMNLQDDESAWLSEKWSMCCADISSFQIYCGRQTELNVGSSHCYLTNSYCPICLMQKLEFEVHHCIWASDGGPDIPSNLLAICNTCHAIITRGSVEDQFPKNVAALFHQLAHFGVNLIDDAISGKQSRKGTSFVDCHPSLVAVAKRMAENSLEKRQRLDGSFKKHCRAMYQYGRDLSLGKWTQSAGSALVLGSVRSGGLVGRS